MVVCYAYLQVSFTKEVTWTMFSDNVEVFAISILISLFSPGLLCFASILYVIRLCDTFRVLVVKLDLKEIEGSQVPLANKVTQEHQVVMEKWDQQ